MFDERLNNSEEWCAATKRQCLNSYCLAVLLNNPARASDSDANDPAAVNIDNNISLLLKKTITVDFLPFDEKGSVADTYAVVLRLFPQKDMGRRRIIAEVRALHCSSGTAASTSTPTSSSTRSSMGDCSHCPWTLTQGEAEAESHPGAHLSRLLGGLANTALRGQPGHQLFSVQVDEPHGCDEGGWMCFWWARNPST